MIKLHFLFLSERMLSDQFAGIALAEASDNTVTQPEEMDNLNILNQILSGRGGS